MCFAITISERPENNVPSINAKMCLDLDDRSGWVGQCDSGAHAAIDIDGPECIISIENKIDKDVHSNHFVPDLAAWLENMASKGDLWTNTATKKFKSDAFEYRGSMRLRCFENQRSARYKAFILVKFKNDCSGWDIITMDPGPSPVSGRDRTPRKMNIFVAELAQGAHKSWIKNLFY